MIPYHSATQGWLAKLPVNYALVGQAHVPLDCCIEQYNASDKVKLSYHPDGFAQFSGINNGRIISGRDSITGAAKGLGLLTAPLSDPILTGPSFSLVIWGIHDFEIASGLRAGDMVFTVEDFYHRSCMPDSANGYLLEGFVFPSSYWGGVRASPSGYSLMMAFPGFEASMAIINLKVFPLINQESFVGIFASKIKTSFASSSGFNLNGPGARNPDDTGYVLVAAYPALDNTQKLKASLDLSQSEPFNKTNKV